jgi:hypothetical protein
MRISTPLDIVFLLIYVFLQAFIAFDRVLKEGKPHIPIKYGMIE